MTQSNFHYFLAKHGSSEREREKKVSKRWTPALGQQFCAVSSYFLAHYHRLGVDGQRGLNSTEAMLIIQLVDFKWDEKMPFPTVGLLAQRLGVSTRHVRETFKALEGRGFVRRVPGARGGANRYDLTGLFAALEALQASDAEKRDEQAA